MLRFYSKPNNGSRATVVGNHSEGILTLGVSRCGKKDAFDKKKGVTIAESRINGGKHYMKIPMETIDGKIFGMIAAGVAQRVLETKIVT